MHSRHHAIIHTPSAELCVSFAPDINSYTQAGTSESFMLVAALTAVNPRRFGTLSSNDDILHAKPSGMPRRLFHMQMPPKRVVGLSFPRPFLLWRSPMESPKVYLVTPPKNPPKFWLTPPNFLESLSCTPSPALIADHIHTAAILIILALHQNVITTFIQRESSNLLISFCKHMYSSG